jgi:hypothetical protein
MRTCGALLASTLDEVGRHWSASLPCSSRADRKAPSILRIAVWVHQTLWRVTVSCCHIEVLRTDRRIRISLTGSNRGKSTWSCAYEFANSCTQTKHKYRKSRICDIILTRLRVSANHYHCLVILLWSEFLATDPEVPGSILGATSFSEYHWFWNGVHSASWG